MTSKNATLIGYLGLMLWAFTASVVAKISSLPTFQCLAIALMLSFLFCAIKITVRKKWSVLSLKNKKWIIPALCFSGNLIFYALSFKHAPAEQADLIIYLWPTLVVVFSQFFLPSENIQFKHILATLIGISGISFLILSKSSLSEFSFNSPHFLGYIFAFCCALCWSTYTILSRRNQDTPPEMIGIYCGLGAPVALALHFFTETAVMPNPSEMGCLTVYGIAILGLAYTCWDVGVKRGNFKLLSILSYGNPILSVLLLVVFGETEFSSSLGIASALVAASAVVAKA